MRSMWAVCKRELLAFFVSPIAYFVITGFVLLAGYFFFVYLLTFLNVVKMYQMMPYRGGLAPNLNQYVVEGFFQTMVVILVFLVPLLTMRLIAEDKRRGTFELLITSPLSIGELVLGKFMALAIVLTIMLSLILFFPMLLVIYGDPGPEVGPMLSGWLGILLCSFSFAAVGMACSSFTENQIVAGVSSMVVLLLLYVVQAPAESLDGISAEILKYISPIEHLQDLLKGVISLKSVVYFLSLTALGVFLSQRALEAHRWR